jgi:hypothetical protein
VNKVILGVIAVLLIAVAGVGVYLMQNLDGIVKNVIEKVGTEVVNTDVRVQEVKLNLPEGQVTLSGFTVANPPGFSSEPLFTLDSITVAIDTASLAGPVYVINEISVDGVHVLAEQIATATNVQTLLDGMSSSEEPVEAEVPETAEGAQADIRIAIAQINFADGSMELRSDQTETRTIELKKLQFTNMGTPENGLTPEEMAREMAGQLVGQILKAVKSAISDLLRRDGEATMKSKLGSMFSKDKD